MDQSLRILNQLANVGSTLKDAETGQRGYLLTGEDRYLNPYTNALSQLQGELDELQGLAAAGEIPKIQVDRLTVLSNQKLEELDLTIRLRRAQNQAVALAMVRSDRGKWIMDQVRSILAQMQAKAQAEFNEAEHQAWWSGVVRTVVFAIAGVLNLAFLAWAYRKISSERLALQQSESRFRALVTASSDVIYRMNPDWSEMRHLRGRDFIADAVSPNTSWFQRYVHPKDQPQVRAAITEAIRTKSISSLEHQIMREDGSLGWIFSRAVPLLDARGEIIEWCGAASDITERKESEQKLRTQLARLHLLSQTTRAIGERQDLKSIFQVVIHSVEEHLPVDFGCICLHEGGNTLTVSCVGAKSRSLALELDMAEQAKIPIDANGLSRCLGGQLVYEPDIQKVDFPFPQRLAGGGLRSMVIAPLLVESKVFGVVIAARSEAESFSSTDCEFLRQLSEHVALASHQAQLHEALHRAYEDLRQTQQAIMQQERLRALGQMASGIAHDINNAISPVALYTQSLLEKEPNLSERARGYLQTIKNAIGDVAATVARMREFYRQREPELATVAVDLNKLIPQVLELTRARWVDMLEQRGIMIALITKYAADLPPIKGVESEIRESLINLVFNAVDAMPEGGTLTLRTNVVEIDSNRRVQVEVTDTGIGMDEATRERCLEPFFTTKGERGTGLGLAMVYGMVKRHNATLEIESEAGKGTTMRMVFDASTVPGAAGDEPSKTYAIPSRLRILIIDDDPLLLKSLRDTLEDDGHVVISANAGEAGIETFRKAQERKEAFAVVITDLGMPNLDGRKVAGAIKGLSPSTPVILLTGWGQRLIDEQDVPAHVDRVLNKPPHLSQLREALFHCCASKQNLNLP